MDEEEIINMEIAELWKSLQVMLEKEDTEGIKYRKYYTEELEIIKQGKRIKVPIWYLTEHWYEEYPSSKKAKILGYGKYDITDFKTEIETRETIIRTILIENLEDESSTTPRG